MCANESKWIERDVQPRYGDMSCVEYTYTDGYFNPWIMLELLGQHLESKIAADIGTVSYEMNRVYFAQVIKGTFKNAGFSIDIGNISDEQSRIKFLTTKSRMAIKVLFNSADSASIQQLLEIVGSFLMHEHEPVDMEHYRALERAFMPARVEVVKLPAHDDHGWDSFYADDREITVFNAYGRIFAKVKYQHRNEGFIEWACNYLIEQGNGADTALSTI